MDVDGDFLVIGSGIAGLRAALTLADYGDVVVLTKAGATDSNTDYAQGGIAVAIGADDSPDLHASDTLVAGDGLCDPAAVDVLVREGPKYVMELLDWGAAFDVNADGTPALAREAAHSVRRVLHARDATGREIGRLLWSRVSVHPRIRVLQDTQATGLAVADGTCRGVRYATTAFETGVMTAASTLLATGGAGQVFMETTNPPVATGDGIAMAALAGARITDMEFVQFHPTVMRVANAPRFLLSEALRGEGAHLINDAGERFMTRYETAGELAPRDRVSRAIAREMMRTGGVVYLSMAHLDHDFIRTRFPTIANACARVGLDVATDRIPVSPAAHYMMGGIETDLHGRTSIHGLFAAGEVACTGVHGANRLASNSLLEGLVFGARAAAAMVSSGRPSRLRDTTVQQWRECGAGGSVRSLPDVDAVRELMWSHCGLLRERAGLEEAVSLLEGWFSALRAVEGASDAVQPERQLTAVVVVSLLVARAALRRTESRGAHFRSDFPVSDDIHWKKHVADVLA